MAQDIVAKIQAAAQASGVDPDVALRIAGVESSFRPAAKNTESTAAGLFQVTGPTWKQYGGKPGKQRDVDENIRVGMKILSSNKASMQEFLGREPLPSDIYAAHFFGPTGARAVMSADPLTPVASVVSKQVMEANPQLAGKTANEVLTGFKQKFDKGGKRYPTSEPVKTTTVGQGTRTMDQEAGAAAPALSARDRVAGMGSNYQAALAAMMLGEASDEDDKDDDTDTPKEEAYKAPAAANALSELDLGSTVSPFDAMEPAVQPEGAKYPMRFAGGGFVPKAAYSPTEKRELEDFNNQWQGYQDQYDTWRKEQYDPYQAAYDQYQTEVYNPYQTAYKAYESDYAKYAKAMDAYNAALPTRPMSTTEAMSYRPPVRPDEPVAPTLAREFTMEAPTTNLRPPGLTQEAYAGMDQAALDKYAQEQSAAASARATQASADQRNRQSALNVAFNPEQFNLSLPDRIASRFMAEGGLALPVGEAFTIKTAQDLQAKPYYDLEEMAKQDDSIWSKLPSEVFGIPISQDAYKQAALSGLGYAVGLGPLMNKVNQATGLVKTGLNIYDIATGQYLPNNPEVYQINNANIPARESGMPAPVISSMSQPPAPVVNLSTPYVPASGSQHWGGTPAPAPALSPAPDYGTITDFGGRDSSVGYVRQTRGFDAGYGGYWYGVCRGR
jgi:hypothetical protein